VSREELVDGYLKGEITRRVFIRRLVAAGVSLSAAVAYSQVLRPQAAAAHARGSKQFYDFYDFYGFYEDTRRMKGHARISGGLRADGTKRVGIYTIDLHCDPHQTPNKLRVKWGAPPSSVAAHPHHIFDLDTLFTASCKNDPTIPTPPAGFDTIEGTGRGHLEDGRIMNVKFKFVDDASGADTGFIQLRRLDNTVLQTFQGFCHDGGNTALTS
jgi:hypothetical protein